MKKVYLILSIFTVVVLFGACKKNNSSPKATASTQLSFGIAADNTTTPLSTNSTSGLHTDALTGAQTITWSAGLANVNNFQLQAEKNNTQVEINSNSLSNVDLFAAVPSVVNTTVDTGAYTNIQITVLFTQSTSTGLPFVLSGVYVNKSGLAIPVELDFNSNAQIMIEAQNVHITGTTNLLTIVGMHLNLLTNNVTAASLDAATLTNGGILISSTVNTSIYSTIQANVNTCLAFRDFEQQAKN